MILSKFCLQFANTCNSTTCAHLVQSRFAGFTLAGVSCEVPSTLKQLLRSCLPVNYRTLPINQAIMPKASTASEDKWLIIGWNEEWLFGGSSYGRRVFGRVESSCEMELWLVEKRPKKVPFGIVLDYERLKTSCLHKLAPGKAHKGKCEARGWAIQDATTWAELQAAAKQSDMAARHFHRGSCYICSAAVKMHSSEMHHSPWELWMLP